MPFEDMKAAALVLLDEIMSRPENSFILQEQLREKIAEFRNLGLPVPGDLSLFEKRLEEDEAEALFDNMPV
ncbi:hypothetical protein [Cochlodiniinecator piscidefendens]|uniref:hypothetical protein n=1 Tax=Cochlodiniinecator piscidefendens TaxID=2715756 RepID=UPI00140E528E|nr:hypothetical protein [Cochlodiniinecator piscidefendens]